MRRRKIILYNPRAVFYTMPLAMIKKLRRMSPGFETPLRWPLQRLARWRCNRDFYRLPVEKVMVERLKPQLRLS